MNNMKEINLSQIFSALLRKAWLIVVCAVLAGTVAYVYTANFIAPLYRSSISIYVNNTVKVENPNSVSANDLVTSQELVRSYVTILESDNVLSVVAEQVGHGVTPGYIRAGMSAYSLNETEIFEVAISDTNPKMAARIANAIADVAPIKIPEIKIGSSAVIIDRAEVAGAPYTPNRSRNTVMGIGVGAVIAVAIIVLQVMLDVRIKSEEDLAAISDAPVLGLIPDLVVDKSNAQYGYSGYKYSAYKSNDKADDSKGAKA